MPERLWTKGFVLVLGVGFCISTVFYLLITTMALYAAEEFNAGDAAAGLASSIFVIGAVSARLFAGAAADRLGRRRVTLVALVVFVVAGAAYFLADSLAVLLVVRVLHGMSFGTAHTAVSAIAQSLIPSSRRAEGTGYFGASSTLATAVGPLIAVLLLRSAGGVLALGGVLLMRVPRSEADPASGTRHRPRRLGALLEPRAIPIALFMLTVGIAYSGVLAFLNSYAEQLDLTSAAAVFFLVYSVVVLALRLPIGRLQDVRGDNVVLYPAIVAFAAGLLVLAVAQSGTAFLLAAALMGAGWGTILSGAQAIAVASAPIQNVGKVIATFFVVLDAGVGLGPIALGLLAGATDYRTMYLLLAALTLVSAVVYYFAHGRRSSPRS